MGRFGTFSSRGDSGNGHGLGKVASRKGLLPMSLDCVNNSGVYHSQTKNGKKEFEKRQLLEEELRASPGHKFPKLAQELRELAKLWQAKEINSRINESKQELVTWLRSDDPSANEVIDHLKQTINDPDVTALSAKPIRQLLDEVSGK